MVNILADFKVFFEHINKKRFSLMLMILFLLLIWLIIIFLIPTTVSKYSSTSNSSADTEVAFYLLKTSHQNNTVLLNEITPRNEPYVYTFQVSNNDGTNRTETDLEYDLSIRTTTNLPLTYDLYLNEEYTDQGASSIITNQDIVQDEDDTYFNTFETDTKYFYHSYNETNTYQLVVYFPNTYVDEIYQDIIESIEITVDSRQVIE